MLKRKKKLPNQAEILVEMVYDSRNAIVGCYFSLSNLPFVTWRMGYLNRSCYWGHYFEKMHNMFKDVWDTANKRNPINIEKFIRLETDCVKLIDKDSGYEKCNCNEAEIFSCYGRLPNGQVEVISDHYNATDCNTWAKWLGEQFNKPTINLMKGKFDN